MEHINRRYIWLGSIFALVAVMVAVMFLRYRAIYREFGRKS